MRLWLVLAGGAVAGIAAASPRLGGDSLAFELGVFVGGAVGGAAFAYLIARAFRWL